MFGSAVLAQQRTTFWMPEQSSTIAPVVDKTFYFIFWISVFFFILISVLMIAFVIKYRVKEGQKPAKEALHHHLGMELTWTFIPLAIVIAIFWVTFTTFMEMTTAPVDALQINVTGQKWKWMFDYSTKSGEPELIVPVNKPVKLRMRSEDVIHSFFIPEFRVKQDVVPGRYTYLWFEATEEGEYWVFCTEFCGTGHSDMLAKVRVVTLEEFNNWLGTPETIGERSPAEAGESMFNRYGCIQCHTVDGVASTGPTMLDAYNNERKLADGSNVLMDENYIRESLLDPGAQVRDGFQAVMPTFQGKLNEDKIDWLIAYLKTVSSHTPPNELAIANLTPKPEAEEGEDGEAGEVSPETDIAPEPEDSTGTAPEDMPGGDA